MGLDWGQEVKEVLYILVKIKSQSRDRDQSNLQQLEHCLKGAEYTFRGSDCQIIICLPSEKKTKTNL